MSEGEFSEGKFAADFISANLEKIISIGKITYGKVDASVQINLKTAYKDYLTKTRLKYSKAKSFFIRNQPVELYSYYVPTGISCGNRRIDKPSFLECTEFTNHIVITGTGGAGKSVLIRHLFLDCIANKHFAPVLIELRDLNSYEKSLDEFIKDTLDTFGFNVSGPYINKAKEAGHFCFFFDGADEVTPKLKAKVMKQILTLSKHYPQCPIFISSRPDDVLDGIEDFSTFKMLPLELDDALNLVAKLPCEEITKNNFSKDLSSGLFEKHKSFLSNPLLLSIMLLTYGENAEIPSKLSIFYNQAYEALFHKHDANKELYSRKRLTSLDIQDFSKLFALFCLQTYEKRLFKMPRTQCIEFIEKSISILGLKIKPEDYLGDLLSAACLLIEDGLEITFSHRSFQEYFVALQISNSPPAIQEKLVERYWLNIHSDSVIHLLREINPDLVERALFVPRLEELFKGIGVTRGVGITHYVRFMKSHFASIGFEGEDLVFTYQGSNSIRKVSEVLVLRMVAKYYAQFAFQTSALIKQENKKLYEDYGKDTRRDEYKTEELTIKSPIILAIANGSGAFTIRWLQAAFEGFKMLKAKQMNPAQSLDVLLGIR